MLGKPAVPEECSCLTYLIEYVDHLHEHFVYPSSINSNGHYNVPIHEKEGYRWVSQRDFSVRTDSGEYRTVYKCMNRALPSISILPGLTGLKPASRSPRVTWSTSL